MTDQSEKKIVRSITFKLDYEKLKVDGKVVPMARLLMVNNIPLEDFSTSYSLNEYHQLIKAGDKFGAGPRLRYSERYVMLTFLKPDGNVFLELRPYYAGKEGKMSNEEYYRSMVGEDFKIKIM